MAPLELHLDLRPGVVDPVALLDEPVVERDRVDHEQDDQDDDRDQHPGHRGHSSIAGRGVVHVVAALRQTQIMSSPPR